jgi:hypothetical protein
MKKATAVWLLDNTTLTFKQIAEFCGLHELEVNGIADGEVASGIRAINPIINNQLTLEEIKRCELDQLANLTLFNNPAAEGEKRSKGPKYTPLSKRQDKPAAIAWVVKFHPEISDAQISKLIGTTKNTIKAIRERTHWNINSLTPTDPVILGLCRQTELDKVLEKYSKSSVQIENSKNAVDGDIVISSTEDSLSGDS